MSSTAACTSTKQQQSVVIQGEMVPDPEFASAQKLLSGFDLTSDRQFSWVPGDRALYGLRLETSSQTQRWYLRVTVLGPETFIEGIRATELPLRPTHWFRPVTVTKDDGSEVDHTVYLDEFTQVWPLQFEVFDADANLLATSTTLTTPEYLMRDLHQYATPSGPQAPERQLHWSQNGHTMAQLDQQIRQQMRQVSQVIASLHTIAMTYVSAEALTEVRKKAGSTVIKAPGLLDLPWVTKILRDGAVMLIEPDFAHAQPVKIPWLEPLGESRGYAVDVNVEIQDRKVMHLNVVVVPPVRPLEGTAGIAELRAWHLDDPNRIFFMQLLAAKAADEAPVEFSGPPLQERPPIQQKPRQ